MLTRKLGNKSNFTEHIKFLIKKFSAYLRLEVAKNTQAKSANHANSKIKSAYCKYNKNIVKDSSYELPAKSPFLQAPFNVQGSKFKVFKLLNDSNFVKKTFYAS